MTRIRHHPKLRDSWPPQWAGAIGLGDKFLIRERADATLTGLGMYSDHITLQVNHEGNTHRGSIPCEDQTLRESLQAFLSQHIGLSISEIGDLEIDF